MDREPSTCTHNLGVVVEPAEGAWRAWCPTLPGYGAATWGATRGEALGHPREVVATVWSGAGPGGA